MSKRILPNIDILIKHYVDEKMNLADICRNYGLSTKSRSNLSRMLKNQGISIRQDKGNNHHNWKGGKINKGSNYIGIWNPNHNKADKQGYVYEHTLIMENYIGRELKGDEEIHHIDLNKHNNEINNLCLCTHKSHMQIHRSIENLIPLFLQNETIFFDKNDYKYKIKINI